ncbi:FAD-dependent thymidylate synthase, partial [candidate division TA06 bacterium]|nr:FAD-dependent thymidylate synthase [candidate division TA06 bacterium]
MKRETFSPEEEALLSPYVTNLDKPIFALTSALPQVIAGAGFSRYSRSRASLRRVLLDEFLKDGQRGIKTVAKAILEAVVGQATPLVKEGQPDSGVLDKAKALEIAREVYQKLLDPSESIQAGEAFYERVLEQFGDESVNELMGGHIALEGVSNILTKVLEDPRLLSPIEKSTRYVVFEVDDFYREPRVMASKHKGIYEETSRFLLKTYADLVDPMRAFLRRKSPKEEFLFQSSKNATPIPIKKIQDEIVLKAATSAYNRTIRGKYCDILRYLLPGATLTNMGIYANGRAHEHLIMKLLASELREARDVGEA